MRRAYAGSRRSRRRCALPTSLWVVALTGLLLLAGSAFAAAIPVPSLAARVTDQTGTLDAAQSQALEAKLAAFEQAKGSQIAVLVVASTGDETIEQFSIRVVDVWKLGRKGVDDGALLLVAKDDRKVRIEVGRGLEGVVPDAIANRIIDEDIVPKFKQGDFAGGLDAGVDRMVGLVNGEPLPPPKPQGNFDHSVSNGDAPFLLALVAFGFARALFGSSKPLVRGLLTGGAAGIGALLAGAVFGFALALAALGFIGGLLSGGGGRFAGGGGWGGWGGGGGSSGGFGGGGFGGGGGGFSGGGASGGW